MVEDVFWVSTEGALKEGWVLYEGIDEHDHPPSISGEATHY
jgi:hypothetical protein